MSEDSLSQSLDFKSFSSGLHLLSAVGTILFAAFSKVLQNDL